MLQGEFMKCKDDYMSNLDEGDEPGDDFWFSWVFWVMSLTMNEEASVT